MYFQTNEILLSPDRHTLLKGSKGLKVVTRQKTRVVAMGSWFNCQTSQMNIEQLITTTRTAAVLANFYV